VIYSARLVDDVYDNSVQNVFGSFGAATKSTTMWQPQCPTVGDDGRPETDRTTAAPAAGFGPHESTESRYSPVAMLQTYGLSYPSASSQQQQQQHLASLYERQLQQRYEQHYQLQQHQLHASGYVHHNTAASPSPGVSPPQQHQQQPPPAQTSVASRTTKIPDDQVVRFAFE